MKKIYLLLLVVALAGCKKDDETKKTTDTKPTITSVLFYGVTAGSNTSPALDVVINVPDAGLVKSLTLYVGTSTKLGTINSPASGKYTMYNHLGDWDGRQPPKGSYTLTFTMTDNTTVSDSWPK